MSLAITANSLRIFCRLSEEEMTHIGSFDRGPEGRLVIPMLNGKPRDGAHKFFPFNIEF